MKGFYIGQTYVQLLIRHELALADLYEAFAEKVSLQSTLWKSMAREERAHADVLTQLQTLLENGQASFKRPAFNTDHLYESLEHLAVLTTEIRRHGIEPERALAYALSAERSILENEFFLIAEEDSPEIKREFDALREHTRQHYERLTTGQPSTDQLSPQDRLPGDRHERTNNRIPKEHH